jgi:homocysteine S-methyltransferase
VRYRNSLPQLDGRMLLCDGGTETTLIFHDGLDLPCFAIFPLLEHEEGRSAMRRYFAPYLETARLHGAGFELEANSRGSPECDPTARARREPAGSAYRHIASIADAWFTQG